MTPERIRELLDVAEDGRNAIAGIDAGQHNESITIAWQCLNELCEALWDAYTTPPTPTTDGLGPSPDSPPSPSTKGSDMQGESTSRSPEANGTFAGSGGETTVDLDALRVLAQTATQGPWTVEDSGDGEHVIWMLKEGESRGCFGPQHQIEWRHGLYPGESTDTTWGDGEQWDEVDATARYIAAMNPWVTLALLDALEEAAL